MAEDEKSKLVWLLLAAILGSTGISTGIQKMRPSARFDGFTGSQGTSLERRIDKLEASVILIQYRLKEGHSREHKAIRELESSFTEHMRHHP